MTARREAERFLTAAQVQARYGVSKMTLWRWCNHRHYLSQGFPCPVKLGGSGNYWRLSELEIWENSRQMAARARWHQVGCRTLNANEAAEEWRQQMKAPSAMGRAE